MVSRMRSAASRFRLTRTTTEPRRSGLPSAPRSGLARPSAPLETLRRRTADAATAAVEMGGGESGRLFGESAAAAAADVGESLPGLRAESGVVSARA